MNLLERIKADKVAVFFDFIIYVSVAIVGWVVLDALLTLIR